MSALNTVKKLFPQVKKVVDATKTIYVSVSKADSKLGRKKDFANCALAKACLRQRVAEGAIIGLSFSYLIKGNIATRYKTSQTVSREITSFDRHQDFAAGKNYCLSKVSKGSRLDAHIPHDRRGKENGKLGKRKHKVHRTAFVRKLKSL